MCNHYHDYFITFSLCNYTKSNQIFVNFLSGIYVHVHESPKKLVKGYKYLNHTLRRLMMRV